MFMDYNFHFMGMPPDPSIMDGMLLHTVAVAVLAPELICFYFLKLEITNIINKYNQKKHDITDKNSTVGSLCNNMGIPALQVYYVPWGVQSQS